MRASMHRSSIAIENLP